MEAYSRIFYLWAGTHYHMSQLLTARCYLLLFVVMLLAS
jgi:hypothetical protein